MNVWRACLAVTSLALGVVLAAPANAETTAIVKAQTTQRMNGPNLKSGQEGVYKAGQVLTLVCHTPGEPVKGFFSFNIPNGGWDNLWYKTSDNHYVADVDIETHTLNAVGPDCGNGGGGGAPASAPTPGAKEDRAVAWANSKVGSNDYVFACGRFVANAYGKSELGVGSALVFHDQLANAGQIHPDMNFPKGALVFSESHYDIYKGVHQGHVMIARGDGTFVSGGVDQSYQRGKPEVGGGSSVQILKSWNPAPDAQYRGWAYPPADWPGA